MYQTILGYHSFLSNPSFEELPAGTEGEDNNGEGSAPPGEQTVILTPMKALSEKSILMVISFKDFRDEEYFVPRQVFQAAGAKIKTASNEKGTAMGTDGGTVEIDFLVEEVNLADFDAVVFAGGPGCLKYLDNEKSYNLINETVSEGKLLGAICIGPVILAKAGALEGKKATVWSSSMDKSPIDILSENGAVYQEEAVVRDGLIITGFGPSAAEEFGMEIVGVLTGI